MKKIIFLFICFVVSGFLKTYGQSLGIVKFGQLKTMFEQSNDTTYVFNFWATWCSPCVNEFPEFQKLSSAYANKKIRFIFISLDFKKDFETALTPFVKKHDVKNDVFLLDEPDYNVWINKVDPSWNGDIPMTLVINNKMKIRNMYAREFTYDELEKTIRPIIQ